MAIWAILIGNGKCVEQGIAQIIFIWAEAALLKILKFIAQVVTVAVLFWVFTKLPKNVEDLIKKITENKKIVISNLK